MSPLEQGQTGGSNASPAWLIPRRSEQIPAAEPTEEIPRGVFHLLLFANHFNGMGAMTWPGLAAVTVPGWAFLAITSEGTVFRDDLPRNHRIKTTVSCIFSGCTERVARGRVYLFSSLRSCWAALKTRTQKPCKRLSAQSPAESGCTCFLLIPTARWLSERLVWDPVCS